MQTKTVPLMQGITKIKTFQYSKLLLKSRQNSKSGIKCYDLWEKGKASQTNIFIRAIFQTSYLWCWFYRWTSNSIGFSICLNAMILLWIFNAIFLELNLLLVLISQIIKVKFYSPLFLVLEWPHWILNYDTFRFYKEKQDTTLKKKLKFGFQKIKTIFLIMHILLSLAFFSYIVAICNAYACLKYPPLGFNIYHWYYWFSKWI